MSLASEFSAALAESRAGKSTSKPHAAPSLAAPAAPAPSRYISWDVIATELNTQAGFAHGGPNVDVAAARSKRGPAPDLDRRLSQTTTAQAASWDDVAASLNAESGLTSTSNGARYHG